ncbi:TIGR03862 family flavoprotein [Rhizobium paknamense]|uniref:Flavoprotein (TIGR03862 family) n=1 Tax=Rhizobium paknamense TaxID=1206817 RepID=A0ABU0IGG7_9HYPH|nr:TIGR03862 family flavoprotein [Rhizobium paknamense]MDQ0457338.1 putative flavoprotein (TIGR03862 family) [Rhizobium paknamense]
MQRKTIAIIGGGPAGLMAAETVAGQGHEVTVYDAMPTMGRKFLLAGKSGLNLTHSEDYARFRDRYGAASPALRAALDDFTPQQVSAWAEGLGQEVFTGSSGRVFPKVMKASPLLRQWLKRLEAEGVQLLTRHRWTGFEGAALRFLTPAGESIVQADATLLALGGASWPKLGSDAAWTQPLQQAGVRIAPFRPANCGFDVAWSDHFISRFAGMPVKAVAGTSAAGRIQGEFVISRHGIEGSLVYAHAAALRDGLEQGETAWLLDLAPGRKAEKIAADLNRQPAKASLSNRLRKAAGLDGVKLALLRERAPDMASLDASQLADLIKALPVPLIRPRPIAEAISSAGGVLLSELTDGYMLAQRPGLFLAGEMLDWEAPTGGYLLTACFATGRAAGKAMLAWLQDTPLSKAESNTTS